MYKLWTILILILVPAAHAAEVNSSAWTTYERLRNGAPPAVDPAALTRWKQDLVPRGADLKRLLGTEALDSNSECERFVKTTRRTLTTLNRTLLALKTNDWNDLSRDGVYARVRLQLTIPLLAILNDLFAHARDGGYGFIDGRPTRRCQYKDRAAVSRSLKALASDYERFSDEVLGHPGLIPLERVSARLLALSERQQTYYDYFTMGYFVGTFALSWFVVTNVLLPYVHLAVPAFARLGVSGLMGFYATENLAYIGVERWLNPEPGQRGMGVAPTFAQTMTDVESVVYASFRQPQIYYAYLSTVQGELARLIGRWYAEHQKELEPVTQ